MQETWVQSLGPDPLEKGMATHSSILAWKTPRTEEPRVGHDWATNTFIMRGRPPQLNGIQGHQSNLCASAQSWPHAICDVARQGPPSMEVSILEYVASSSSKYNLGVSLFPLHLIPHYHRTFCTNISKFSSLSVVCDFWRPHGLQHARPPCPSLTPRFTQTNVHSVGDAT